MEAGREAERRWGSTENASNNAGLTEEERQRAIELIAAAELEKQRGTKPIRAVCDNGKSRPVREQKENNLSVVPVSEIEEQVPNWLIPDYIPRYQITTMAGDGGSGKTTVWCAIAAAISNGTTSFLLKGTGLEDAEITFPPGKVMIFSSEDSLEYTLVRRLRKNGANLKNIISIPISDERFEKIKFDSDFLRDLLEGHRPVLCVFDPIQAFIPPHIKMGDRNAMRSCMAPLIGYGENLGVTFLIAMHSNKQSGVWGRKRMADSSDVWDISRSVLMIGETNQKEIRYISHEKSNYGKTASTVLFTIEDEVICWKSYTDKKDRDFVTEHDFTARVKPQRDEAKEFILDFLKDGEKEVSELDEMAKVMGISTNALKNAKSELRTEGKTKTWSIGFNPKRYFIRLLEGESLTDTFKPN